jgi:hypothetical protein
MTIADLARDGILTVTMIGKSASARLTPRGAWFVRTLAAEFAVINVTDSANSIIGDQTERTTKTDVAR